jgi:photosystem II stability/assembly factor-like uncharacterized protein
MPARFYSAAPAALALAALLLAPTAPARAAPPSGRQSLASLARVTHFHGIAVDPQDSSRLFLATHHGFYAVTLDGQAERISEHPDDFMGFSVPAGGAGLLYASGHPAQGGNLGVMASGDGGRTWRQISPGLNGPVDFHQMAVSQADPKVMVGAYGVLQMSQDGGTTWAMAGREPDGLVDIAISSRAVSSRSAPTIYAATRTGLLVSRDGGKSWTPAHPKPILFTLVESGPGGSLYAFAVGAGFLRADEEGLTWTALNNGFGERVLLHLAIDPRAPARLYGAAQDNTLWMSADGGRNWKRMGGE